jgi:hypothetical protein
MSLFSVRKEDDYLSKQYDAGRAAALKGMEHWENPHVMGTSSIASSIHWYAGWCNGKQYHSTYGREGIYNDK